MGISSRSLKFHRKHSSHIPVLLRHWRPFRNSPGSNKPVSHLLSHRADRRNLIGKVGHNYQDQFRLRMMEPFHLDSHYKICVQRCSQNLTYPRGKNRCAGINYNYLQFASFVGDCFREWLLRLSSVRLSLSRLTFWSFRWPLLIFYLFWINVILRDVIPGNGALSGYVPVKNY